MFHERLQVVVNEDVKGRPRARDVRLYRADGRAHPCVLVSPSGVSSFLLCERKWGFSAIDHMEKVESAAQKKGTAWHGELDGWLSTGTPPKTSRIIETGVLDLFPLPRTPGMETEQVFAFLFGPTEETAVAFWGFKDVEVSPAVDGLPIVYDFKTSKSLDWAKTEFQLLEDPQAIIYAFDVMLKFGARAATVQWNYATTQGDKESCPSTGVVEFDHAERVLTTLWQSATRMVAHKRTIGLKAAMLEPNAESCGAFGGCEFRGLCPDVTPKQQVIASHKQSRLELIRGMKGPQASALARAEKTMSNPIADRMKADVAARSPEKAAEIAKKLAEATHVAVSGSAAEKPKPTEEKKEEPKAEKKETAEKKPASAAVNKLRGFINAVPGASAAIAAAEVSGAAAAAATTAEETEKKKPGRPPGAKNKPKDVEPAANESAAVIQLAGVPLDVFVSVNLVSGEWAARTKDGSAAGSGATRDAALENCTKAAAERAARAAAAAAVEASKPPKAAREVASPGAGFWFFLDVLTVKGDQLPLVEELIAPSRTTVEADLAGEGESPINYRLKQGFPTGSTLLAAQLEADFKENPPMGFYAGSSKVLDKEVLDVLQRFAAQTYKGVI